MTASEHFNLDEWKRKREEEYQERLKDPATIDEAMAWIDDELAHDAPWSGIMTERLYLEALVNEVRRLRGTNTQ